MGICRQEDVGHQWIRVETVRPARPQPDLRAERTSIA